VSKQSKEKVDRIAVVKTGSGVVVDREGRVDTRVATLIAKDIERLQEHDWSIVWVASGAVAKGKAMLGYQQERNLSTVALQAVSAVGQGQLFGELSNALSLNGMQAAQALLTFGEISNRESYRRVLDSFLALLRWGVVPIVNENDSVTTEGISFGNNDFLAAQLAALLGAKRLVLLTNVPGVLTDDPSQGTEGTVIPRIGNVDELLNLGYSRIGGRTGGGLGTGGMRGKLRAAQLASQGGVSTSIGSIATDSVYSHVEGTAHGSEVPAGEIKEGRGASFRFWLLHAVTSAGTIVIDEGAANAIMRRGASLLAVGVVRAEEDFTAGDAVDVCDQDGRTIAKGIARYTARELSLLIDARHTLKGGQLPEEVIHRDEMVLLTGSALNLQ
jgi:glutamate 5-kinase